MRYFAESIKGRFVVCVYLDKKKNKKVYQVQDFQTGKYKRIPRYQYYSMKAAVLGRRICTLKLKIDNAFKIKDEDKREKLITKLGLIEQPLQEALCCID